MKYEINQLVRVKRSSDREFFEDTTAKHIPFAGRYAVVYSVHPSDRKQDAVYLIQIQGYPNATYFIPEDELENVE